jgi:hypothetical protein
MRLLAGKNLEHTCRLASKPHPLFVRKETGKSQIEKEKCQKNEFLKFFFEIFEQKTTSSHNYVEHGSVTFC